MLLAFLLPLLVAGAPSPSIVAPDDPPVRLWINHDRHFVKGDRAKVEVRARDDGYLVVLHADADGYLRVLFPLDPGDDNFVRGGDKFEVHGRGGREAFTVDADGRGTLYAAVSRDPFHYDGVVTGNHWDYRALSPSRLSRQPEAELTELVRRLAQGDFDYDLLTYDVVERVVYASTYDDYVAPDYGYRDSYWGGYGYGRPYYGNSFAVSVVFGRPYRRAYYDPFYAGYYGSYGYDPLYYAYDPLYYRPLYYSPYYYTPRYYSPAYWQPRGYYDGFSRSGYRPRSRYDGTPYTPYRFRGGEGTYRDRRTDVRAVNTVYLPPTTRTGIHGSSTRRVTDPTPAAVPSERSRTRETASRRGVRGEGTNRAPAGRSATGRAAERPTIEARRVERGEARRGADWPQEVRVDGESPRATARTPLISEPRRQPVRAQRVGDNSARREPSRSEPVRTAPRRDETPRMAPEPRRAEAPPRAAPRAQPQSGGGGADRGGFSAPRVGGEGGGGGGGRRR
ncbi:MAG: DUF4384 domain-containing protein [Gemmatimonadales bacterium]|nr:DUF4384 domain-containing protein [Gemmatimonadales bacterium]